MAYLYEIEQYFQAALGGESTPFKSQQERLRKLQ